MYYNEYQGVNGGKGGCWGRHEGGHNGLFRALSAFYGGVCCVGGTPFNAHAGRYSWIRASLHGCCFGVFTRHLGKLFRWGVLELDGVRVGQGTQQVL